MRTTPLKHPAAPLFALALLAALLAPARAAADTYWLDGREVEIVLTPRRESFVLGERVGVWLEVENHGDGDLELLLSGEGGAGWPDDFEVRVYGPDGAALPRPKRDDGKAPFSNWNVSGRKNTRQDAPRSSTLIALEPWAKFERPGVYRVVLRRGVKAGPYNGTYRIWPETNKPVAELRAETTVSIVAPGQDPLGRLIEESGARLLGADRAAAIDATTRLTDLNDERVVKHLVEAVRRSRNVNVREFAVNELGKYEMAAAFEGLKLAAADPDDDLRTLAAKAISGYKHPEARALFLKMRRDEHFGVRVVVLNALETMETPEARRMIWEMTNDEHPLVRDEALRFLHERGARPPL